MRTPLRHLYGYATAKATNSRRRPYIPRPRINIPALNPDFLCTNNAPFASGNKLTVA